MREESTRKERRRNEGLRRLETMWPTEWWHASSSRQLGLRRFGQGGFSPRSKPLLGVHPTVALKRPDIFSGSTSAAALPLGLLTAPSWWGFQVPAPA